MNRLPQRLLALATVLLLALPLATAALADTPPQTATRSITITRDDLGISLVGGDRGDYLRILRDLKLAPATSEGNLDVKAPFTLRTEGPEGVNVYSFTTGGVRHNGVLCLPGNPAALAAFYKDDWQGFLTEDYRLFEQTLGISADEVVAVELLRSHYTDTISMRLTDRAAIAALLAEQSEMVVLPLAPGELRLIACGGASFETVYVLRNGSRVSIQHDSGVLRLRRNDGEAVCYHPLSTAQPHPSQLDRLFDATPGLPSLSVALGDGVAAQSYLTAFSYNGQTKQSQSEPPLSHSFEQRVHLPIGAGHTARLAFSSPPSQATAQVVRMEKGQQGASRSATVTADGALALPREPGEYGVTVRATFSAGWAEYFFGFVVSDLPDFFDSIAYGNAEGNVTVTRDDLGRSVTGGQNRQYVTLLQALDLVPDDGATPPGVSRIKKPFTLAFSCEGYPTRRVQFTTQDDRVLLGGKPYRARKPAGFDALYAPASFEQGQSLLEDTKGFLTAEAATFGALYPLRVEDISAITTQEKKMYHRSVSGNGETATYSFTLDTLTTRQYKPESFPAALAELSSLLLARETQNIDAFDYGTYTAYEVLCTDGRRFSLDRRLLLNGAPTGYYLIETT